MSSDSVTAAAAAASSRSSPVDSIMSRGAVTVGMDDSLATVRDLFSRHRFHHLLVLDGQRLVGVISDRDLLRALSPRLGTPSEAERDLATLNKRAHQVMSRRLATVPAMTPIATAGALMLERGVSALPVVAADGSLVGIVSWRDLLRALLVQSSA